MLATLVDKPFDDPDYVFETKWDGFRLIAEKRGGAVRLWSRNGVDVTKKYAVLLPALKKIRGSAVLDGELVALDARGRSRFQLLQNASNKKATLRYIVFDLLSADGKDMRRRPLRERKEALRALLPRDPALHYSEHVARFGTRAFARAKRRDEEGVIAKRAAGLYYSGRRTREWLKVKAAMQQEVVIVGYTDPRRSRQYFGALVLAVREKGAWRYVGRAGTGFDMATLRDIHAALLKLRTTRKPVAQEVPDEAHTHWVRPRLVGEIRFTEWTKGGEMRHPRFCGLRTDKKATEVIRERA
jgi:bifunctional non-homologous end joining protein LigD